MGEPTVGADPPMSTGNPFLEMKTQMAEGAGNFLPTPSRGQKQQLSVCSRKKTDN